MEQILSTRLQLALRLLACSRRQLRSPHYPSISAAEHLATSPAVRSLAFMRVPRERGLLANFYEGELKTT